MFSKNFVKILATIGVCLTVTSSQAGWYTKPSLDISNEDYFSEFYLADGDWRTMKQLKSFSQPDPNGYLYIENVVEYDCSRNSVQVVQSKGFKSWDDQGQPLKNDIGIWQTVKATDKIVLDKICRFIKR